jgi:carbamoyl-phosphate synthase large subunit
MNILITGGGSVMGQSIYKALARHSYQEKLLIHFANSDPVNAGRYFAELNAPVVAAPIFPLAVDPVYSLSLEEYVRDHSIDIVFPGTQHELSKIAIFRDKTLKAATLSSKIVRICTDKVATYHTLKRHGVNVPPTQTLKDYINDDSVVPGSVIIKPNNSSSSRSIFSQASRKDALALAQDLALDPEGFVVQQRLQGKEYTCGCYIDRYTRRFSHIILNRTLTPDGATLFGEITKDLDISQYLASVANALVCEGLDFGHFNVQLILSENGPMLFEINGRLSSTEASKAYYGFNSCAAFISNVVLKSSFDEFVVSESGRFLRYYDEVYFN